MNTLNIIAAGNPFSLVLVCSLLIVVLGTLVFFFSRYRRCPSDKILVIYGRQEVTADRRNVSMVVLPSFGLFSRIFSILT